MPFSLSYPFTAPETKPAINVFCAVFHLSYVVHAADRNHPGCSTQYSDPSFSRIHVKEIIFENNIRAALNFNRTGIGLCSDNDLVSFDPCFEQGVVKFEMLGSAEKYAPAANGIAAAVCELIAVIAIIETIF